MRLCDLCILLFTMQDKEARAQVEGVMRAACAASNLPAEGKVGAIYPTGLLCLLYLCLMCMSCHTSLGSRRHCSAAIPAVLTPY